MRVTLILSIALCIAACSSDDGAESDTTTTTAPDADAAEASPEVTDPLAGMTRAFAVYNVGLATGYVDYAEERLPQLGALLSALDVDVLCLNEVWTQEQIDKIIADTAVAYPYNYYELQFDDTVGPPACGIEETDVLLACVEEQCPGIPASEIAGCVLTKCRTEFESVQPSCSSCLAANIGKEIPVIVDLCRNGGPVWNYDGSDGLMVLSRAPLSNGAHMKIDSSLTQRGIVGVTVELPELGTVAFGCTHIAADLAKDGVQYVGEHGSFIEHNKFQAGQVVEFMASYGAGADMVVLAGDMNSGPGSPPELEEEIPDAGFKVLTDAGYVPYPWSASANNTVCTLCDDNTHRLHASNIQIDHVFFGAALSGWDGVVSQIGTERLEVVLEDGSSVETNPSDHYGIRVQLDKTP